MEAQWNQTGEPEGGEVRCFDAMDGKIFVGTNGGVFKAETTYEIDVDETAGDLDGNLMQHPFSFSFRTAPVGIRGVYPRNGELFVDLD